MSWNDIEIVPATKKMIEKVCDLEFRLYGKIVTPINALTKYNAISRIKDLQQEAISRGWDESEL